MDETSLTSGRRRLSAIMFTDIKGFTSLMERDETTAVGLIKAHREIVRRNITAFQGEERETIGDAFLVIFESAVQAVQCAVTIQQELSEFNRDRQLEKQIWMRIGIHLGDIIIEEGSVFGEGVNLAARVEPLAPPGGVCITQQVLDQIKRRIKIEVHRLGIRELKNVTDVPPIYRLIFETNAPVVPLTLRERIEHFLQKKSVKFGVPPFLALFLGLTIYWVFFATHINYARAISYRYHTPFPVYRISTSKAKTLQEVYKIFSRRGKVTRIEHIDTRGLTPEDVEELWSFQLTKSSRRDYPIETFSYGNDGRVTEKHVFDRFGVLQYKLAYEERGHVATVHDTSGYVKTFENQIAGFGYVFDEKGRLIQWNNRNAFGAFRTDSAGVAIYRITYGPHDLPSEESYYDPLSNLIENKDGVAVRVLTRNKFGTIEREQATDRYHAPKESLRGYASFQRVTDSVGNVVEERYFDRNGVPVETNDGTCLRRFHFTSRGQLSEETSLSCSGSPKANREGWAILRYTYDNTGKILTRDYLDEQEHPTSDASGVHRTRLDYTPEGRIARVSFFGSDGTKAQNNHDIHATTYRYDPNGRPTSRSFLDKEEKPLITSQGYAEMRVRYNERGNAVEWAYFDGDGSLVNSRDGYAVVRNEFDAFGNLISKATFDKNSAPAMSRDLQCHQIKMGYDDKGNLAETRCLDGSLALSPGIKNCAISKYTYNNYGQLTRIECYVEEGKLIDQSNISSVLTMQYDKRGYLSEVRAFDANGSLAERYQGAAIWRRISDAFGNQIEIASYDRDDQLIINPKYRAAIFRREFDSHGNELRLQAFDEHQQPTIGIWGFAEIRYAYDNLDHKISESYFDEQGGPASDRNGVHEHRWIYDDRGRIRKRLYFGKDGKLTLNNAGVAMTHYEYDHWGWLIRASHFGTNEQPTTNTDSKAAIEEYQRDDRGNTIRITYRDADGNPCSAPECIPIIEQQFDTKGRLAKRDFLDAEGKRIADKDGVGAYQFTYDIQGREFRRSLLNTADEPMRDERGIHSYVLHYHPETDTTVWYRTFVDPQGNPAMATDGSMLQIILYDELYREKMHSRVSVDRGGRITRVECFDDTESLTTARDCVEAQAVKREFTMIKPFLTATRETQ